MSLGLKHSAGGTGCGPRQPCGETVLVVDVSTVAYAGHLVDGGEAVGADGTINVCHSVSLNSLLADLVVCRKEPTPWTWQTASGSPSPLHLLLIISPTSRP